MNDDIIIIERFSKKRYETYKAKGIPFHVVCGKGRLCEVKAFDCGDNHDQVFVESTYEYLGKARTSGHYANQKNGCTQYREQDGKLFIYRGPWFKHNDLVVQTRDGIAGREIFFWHGIRPKDNMFLANWGAYSPYDDLHDSDFSQCTLGCDLRNTHPSGRTYNYHFRLATDKDIADYRNALRDHRITWEDSGRFYHYPHVGDHYYEIFFNHGVADFRECVLESEDSRPEISRLIMECDLTVHLELREKRVRQRVDEINKALGLKKITKQYEKKNCTKNRQLQGNASTSYQQGHVPLPSHPRTLEPVNKRQELQHLLRHGQLGTCPHLLTLLSRRARRTWTRL